jgi:hypothetical protein
MKELTVTFNNLLQDKRVRSEQTKYEAIQRQRSSAINKYKRAYQEFLDLEAGLQSAKNWYREMKETVESLEKNVDSFVNNRRSEGAQLLNQIEQNQASSKSAHAEMEQNRLRELMERMSVDQGTPTEKPGSGRPTPAPLFQPGQAPRYQQQGSYQGQGQGQGQGQYGMATTSPPPQQVNMPQQGYAGYGNAGSAQPYGQQPHSAGYSQPAYNPSQYGRNPGPTSPPPTQSTFGMNAMRGPTSPPPNRTSFMQHPQQQHHNQAYANYGASPVTQQSQGGYVPPGFVPPPPPPGPPPLGPQQTVHYGQQQMPQQPQQPQQPPLGYGQPQSAHPHSAQVQQSQDPWSGLNAWK